MKNPIKKLNQGFTIIEVMIVLAIAGLIMAIVFVAVPQLQRNQRDNARQDIANRLKAELETYAGNNQGTYPFAAVAVSPGVQCNTQAVVAGTKNCGDWFTRYINGATPVKITDPGTGANTRIFYYSNVVQPTWQVGDAFIVVGHKCSGEQVAQGVAATGVATSKQYAILISLDRSGTFYCIDNG